MAGHDAVAEDAQPDGAGEAGDAAHPAFGEPHEPFGEAGIEHGPAAGAGFGGRRRGPAGDLFPAADRRLVVAPLHGEPQIVSRQAGVVSWLGEGAGDRVQAVAAFVAVAGPAAAAAVPVRADAGIGGGQQPACPAWPGCCGGQIFSAITVGRPAWRPSAEGRRPPIWGSWPPLWSVAAGAGSSQQASGASGADGEEEQARTAVRGTGIASA